MMMKKTLLLPLAALALGSSTAALAQATCTKQKERYVVQGDTVYDKKTDLTWQRCSIGQRWKEGIGCVGIVRKMDFNTAKSQESGGWRLPGIRELQTLVMADCPEGARINTEIFPDVDFQNASAYWSSSNYSNDGSRVWFVNFGYGFSGDFNRENSSAVRLVRGGQ